MSSLLTPKCSATTSKIREGVISFGLLGYITSFKASSARGSVKSTLFNLAKARILLKAPSSSRILDLILEVVAEHFGVKKEDITSSRRNSEFVLPRQVFMYLCREMTDVSYANVAKMLGKKDHTTIIHGVNKIVEELEMNDELRTKIEVIKKKVSP